MKRSLPVAGELNRKIQTAFPFRFTSRRKPPPSLSFLPGLAFMPE